MQSTRYVTTTPRKRITVHSCASRGHYDSLSGLCLLAIILFIHSIHNIVVDKMVKSYPPQRICCSARGEASSLQSFAKGAFLSILLMREGDPRLRMLRKWGRFGRERL